MTILIQLALGLAGATLAISSCATPTYTSGQQLTPEQVSQLGELPVYRTDTAQYRVLPQKTNDGATLLLTEQGIIAASRHEVSISNASESQVQAASTQGPRPASIQYFSPTGITVVLYADFAQTINGLAVLKTGLPQASVRLPLEFGKLKPY